MSYFLYVQLRDGRFGFLNKTMRTKKVYDYSSSFFELAYDEDKRSDILSFISESAAKSYIETLKEHLNQFPIVHWEIVGSDDKNLS